MMTSDLVQIGVIVKNELIKSVRGKKFLVSLIIVGVVFALMTVLQFIIGTWDKITDMGTLADTYLDTLPMVVTLVVALLSSIALVSEFEERTALILFTRPVRRTSILIGKIISCTILEAAIILVYYILVIKVGLIKVDGFSISILTSYLMAVLYAFAASGIAFIISSFLKKGSVCTIISLLILLIVMPVTSAMVGSDGGENWYMIDQAGDTIYTSIPEYVDHYNEFSREFGKVVQDAVAILSGFTSEDMQHALANLKEFIQSPAYQELDPETQQTLQTIVHYLGQEYTEDLASMIAVLKAMASSSMVAPIENPDLVKETLVLLAWAFIGYFIAWIRFVRREF